MKTVDVRGLQHHLGRYLDDVENGEVLVVRRRKKIIARIVPYTEGEAAEPWPDRIGELTTLYDGKSVGYAASEQISRDRGDR